MYDEILSHKKEGNPAVCDNMDGPWWHYAMWNKLNTVWSHLYVEFKWEKKKGSELTDSEKRLVVIGVRVLEVGTKDEMIKRYKVSAIK